MLQYGLRVWCSPMRLVGPSNETKRRLRPQRVQLRARNVVVAAGVHGTCDLLLRMANDRNGLPVLRELPIGEGVRAPQCGSATCTALDNTDDFDPGEGGERDWTTGTTTTSVVKSRTSRVELSRFVMGHGHLFHLLRRSHSPRTHVLGSSVSQGGFFNLLWQRPWDMLQWMHRAYWNESSLVLHHYHGGDGGWELRLRVKGRRLCADHIGGGDGGAPSQLAGELVGRVAACLPGGAVVSERLSISRVHRAPVVEEVVGGACVASGPDRGVVGADHQVFGLPGLYVVGSAAVGGSLLGRNPALTVAAMAERAVAQIPDSPTGRAHPQMHEKIVWETVVRKSQGLQLKNCKELEPAAA